MPSAGECPPGIFLALPEEVPDGIPLAVKDLFDTAGLVTTYGSSLFADHVPARTAGAVLALEAAGYGAVGKTNLHEFAYGTTSENPHFGVVPNPLAPGRVAGGSSGGNAATLVLGAAKVALGTDSGGSIRIPAACCGIVGFKPSYGLVSLDGCFPLASSRPADPVPIPSFSRPESCSKRRSPRSRPSLDRRRVGRLPVPKIIPGACGLPRNPLTRASRHPARRLGVGDENLCHDLGAQALARTLYYRVRGLNAAQVDTPAMTWSAPVGCASYARRSRSPAGSVGA